jgi:hypothetical protein
MGIIPISGQWSMLHRTIDLEFPSPARLTVVTDGHGVHLSVSLSRYQGEQASAILADLLARTEEEDGS